MNDYIIRQEIREINKKLFAHDILYDEIDANKFDDMIAGIIQRYDPNDDMAAVPTIIRLPLNIIKDDDIYDKLDLLAKQSILVEIDNNILDDKEAAEVLRELDKQEYKIIIRIHESDKYFSLVNSHADYVKFNIKGMPDALLYGKESINNDIVRIAYNIQDPLDYTMAEAAGIKLYEGEYIGKSQQIKLDNNDYSKVNFLEIMTELNKNTSNLLLISEMIGRDALLSAQIIRLANSTYFNIGTKRVVSIDQAVDRIGLENLRSWIYLIQFNRNNKASEELIQISFHRALFCKKISKLITKGNLSKDNAYMIGLFSMLDVLTGKLIEKEIPQLNLPSIVEEAILYREGIGGTLLNLVNAYDDSNKSYVDRYLQKLGINNEQVDRLYYRSLDEVTTLWKKMTKHGGLNQ